MLKCDWFWLGRRLDRVFLSLSSKVVSSGPFSLGGDSAGVWFTVMGGMEGVDDGSGPVSSRVWLLSGDCWVLSSFEARRPFWYCERVT